MSRLSISQSKEDTKNQGFVTYNQTGFYNGSSRLTLSTVRKDQAYNYGELSGIYPDGSAPLRSAAKLSTKLVVLPRIPAKDLVRMRYA